jgi:hypothetical protein
LVIVWGAAAAALVLGAPAEFEKTVRLPRGSVQRLEADEARHSGDLETDAGVLGPDGQDTAAARIDGGRTRPAAVAAAPLVVTPGIHADPLTMRAPSYLPEVPESLHPPGRAPPPS